MNFIAQLLVYFIIYASDVSPITILEGISYSKNNIEFKKN